MLDVLFHRLTQLKKQMKENHKNKVLTSTEDTGWPYEMDGRKLSVQETLVELRKEFASLKKEARATSEDLEREIKSIPRALYQVSDVKQGTGDTLLRLSRSDGRTFISHPDVALALAHDNSDIAEFADVDLTDVGVLCVNEDADGLTTIPEEDLLTIEEVENPTEANRFFMTFLDTSAEEPELDLSSRTQSCVRVYRTSLNNQATVYLPKPTKEGNTTVFIGKDDADEIGLILFFLGTQTDVRRVRRFVS